MTVTVSLPFCPSTPFLGPGQAQSLREGDGGEQHGHPEAHHQHGERPAAELRQTAAHQELGAAAQGAGRAQQQGRAPVPGEGERGHRHPVRAPRAGLAAGRLARRRPHQRGGPGAERSVSPGLHPGHAHAAGGEAAVGEGESRGGRVCVGLIVCVWV